MSVGITQHWAYSILFIILFFIYAAVAIKVTKGKSNKFLRQSHLMLAIFCRAENNRLWLRH